MGEQSKMAQLGSANDVSFVDPTGQYKNALTAMQNAYGQNTNQLQQYSDPNAYMNAFLGQSGNLANIVSGATSPLQQQLNAVAARQASLGGEAALAAMPGAQNSGAGMAAFGEAYASPFAQAQSQIANQQLGLTGNLWNQAMGQYGNQYSNLANIYGNAANQALGNYGQLAGSMGSIYQPQYYSTAPTGIYAAGDWLGNVLGSGGAAAMGGLGGAAGQFLGNALFNNPQQQPKTNVPLSVR